MKKTILLLIVFCSFSVFIAGCAGKDASPPGGNNAAGNEKNAEVDLTLLSSTMIYAQVSNMLANPDEYMGKTIRMNGLYYSSYYDMTKTRYHYVVIEDATACCAQGLEFIWNGKHAYPRDYPEENAKIEIIGVFDSYDELGKTYYYIDIDGILEVG